jgi:phosphatidylinositol alpha-mannosyltransferase
MKIGLVCPYSLDVAGGVGGHVLGLADELTRRGHYVRVIAPGADRTLSRAHVTLTGAATPIFFNGSVARLALGRSVASITHRWLQAHDFDVVHVHEPFVPGLSLAVLRESSAPVVATFHAQRGRRTTDRAFYSYHRPLIRKLAGSISVSEQARRTILSNGLLDTTVIPNGISVATFANVAPAPVPSELRPKAGPAVALLGRFSERRKGFSVFADALPELLAAAPNLRIVIAGAGVTAELLERVPAPMRAACRVVEALGEQQKARLLASVDALIAPNIASESFGVVLCEAMAAGAIVVASDLPAFVHILDHGKNGILFKAGDSRDLAARVTGLLRDTEGHAALRRSALTSVSIFDWSAVADRVLDMYRRAIEGRSVAAFSA